MFDELSYSNGMIYRKGRRVGKAVSNRGYNTYKYKGKTYLVHRIVWYLHHGTWPKCELDHINNDRLDNRIENLRDVSGSTNMRNKNRIKGYIKVGKRYRARYSLNNKQVHIGMYDTEQEARAAYLSAVSVLLEG